MLDSPRQNGEPLLETVGLTKEFRGFVAVKNVSLRVAAGSIHALIGPNGAGKTTCFNLLTKFLTPSAGTIRFKGHNITTDRPAEVARRGVVRSFQISAVFPHLSVLENIRVALQRRRGRSFDFWRSEHVLDAYDGRAKELAEAVGLLDFLEKPAVELPYGRKRALEIATTLALDPELLLLDEPTAGMGHEDVDRIAALIQRVAADRTVLMVEHNLKVVANLSHTITVLARGRSWPRGTTPPSPRTRTSCRPTWVPSMPEPSVAAGEPQGQLAAAMLGVDKLHAWYGESHILHGVDLSVRPGELVTILGRNGAGKTTTLRSLMGMVAQRKGSVKIQGTETIRLPPHRIARLGIAICPEERGIFASLDVEENLLLPPQVAPGGMGLDAILTLFPNLRERMHSQGTKLSGGEQQMLAIARILRTGARLLLLDEPTEGLAPVIVQQIGATIRRLKADGFTILLVEQNLKFAASIADRHYVMDRGRIVDEIAAPHFESSLPKLQQYLAV